MAFQVFDEGPPLACLQIDFALLRPQDCGMFNPSTGRAYIRAEILFSGAKLLSPSDLKYLRKELITPEHLPSGWNEFIIYFDLKRRSLVYLNFSEFLLSRDMVTCSIGPIDI